jgi:sigma-E factor negative regulatory protein RseC
LHLQAKNLNKPSTLQHDGIISHIKDGVIYVDIEVASACSSCHAKGYCSAFGKSDKVIEIPSEQYPDFISGDQVTVFIRESLGMQALLIGYIFRWLPCLLHSFSLIFLLIMKALPLLLLLEQWESIILPCCS